MVRRLVPLPLALACVALPALPTPAVALPDQRAYEQVSPVDKNGANVYASADLVHVSPSGDRLVYFSSSSLPNSEGAQGLTQNLSIRESGDWSTSGLLPPPGPFAGLFQAGVVGWSDDLSQTLVTTNSAANPDVFGLFARDSGDGSLRQIAVGSSGGDSYAFDDATPNASDFLFEDNASTPLVNSGAAGFDNVYQWSATGGLSLVGVLPDGTTPPGGSFAGPYLWPNADLNNGGALNNLYTDHTISDDGSRAFFTAGGTGQIYVRENGTLTVPVSASQKTNGSGAGGVDPNGPRPAAFMAATPDGAEAFFTSSEELTNDAETGDSDQGNDLYSFDVGSGTLTDLTVDADPSDPNGASVEGLLGISDDGSYAFFAATGALAPGAVSGQPNLYLWHDGTTTFITTLNSDQADAMNWAPRASGRIEKASRVTPDGQTLLFASDLPLTGYDNQGHTEFYRYSVSDAGFSCVSCGPGGSSAGGDAYLLGPPLPALLLPARQSALTHNLSDDGGRVFFVSPDALVPQDTNGELDVYEWEESGSGGCQDPAGCPFLISTGQSGDRSTFADASANGDDALFFTSQQLVGQDQDQVIDVYDARVGGGIASQNPPPEMACAGEECKPPPVPAPPYQEPGTSHYSGSGNLAPTHAFPRAHRRTHKHHRSHKRRRHHATRRKGGGNR